MVRDDHLHPDSALNGDNVVERSDAMPWYDGPVLLDLLEQVEVAYDHPYDRPARFPVQWVIRPATGARTARLPRLRGPAGERGAARGRRGRGAPRAAGARGSRRSTPTTASSRRRWRRCRSRCASRTSSTSRAAS